MEEAVDKICKRPSGYVGVLCFSFTQVSLIIFKRDRNNSSMVSVSEKPDLILKSDLEKY